MLETVSFGSWDREARPFSQRSSHFCKAYPRDTVLGAILEVDPSVSLLNKEWIKHPLCSRWVAGQD